MEISFHGGAGTVTGSRHLLEVHSKRILVDAGMFQGLKRLRELNWKKPSFDPRKIDHLLLTHTHIDHAGYLPRLVREGYRGPVHCTRATRDLAEVLLMDSAKIQEEDAKYANKKGFSKHKPALPLYTSRDVKRAIKLFRPVRYGHWIELAPALRARFLQAGHILGSALVQVEAGNEGHSPVRFVFSGDLGRYDMPLHPDPVPLPECDVLVVESTYGDRRHDHATVLEQIRKPFRETFDAGGVVLIPAFAVGRTQQVTLILRELMKDGKLPEVPIHIDSPMAVDSTHIYSRYMDEHNLDACIGEDGRSRLFPRNVFFHRTVAQSKRLNNMKGPRVILSASGMMTGGRVLHHLRRRLPDPRNLLCLVGYQATGTRGRRMLNGQRSIRIHGGEVEVRARFMTLNGLSGHADRDELLRWIGSADTAPSTVFVTHGEPEASDALAEAVRGKMGVRTIAPELGEEFDLDDLLEPRRKG
jgi:metallo-beta-lactamase family protein